MNKGLDPLREGLQPPMLSALIGATVFHFFMNLELFDDVIDGKKKAHVHMAVFFISIGLVVAFKMAKNCMVKDECSR